MIDAMQSFAFSLTEPKPKSALGTVCFTGSSITETAFVPLKYDRHSALNVKQMRKKYVMHHQTTDKWPHHRRMYYVFCSVAWGELRSCV